MGFKPKENVASGVTVELTDGYNCYNKHGYKVEPAKTIIDLQCDLDAGVGVPMPLDNETGSILILFVLVFFQGGL